LLLCVGQECICDHNYKVRLMIAEMVTAAAGDDDEDGGGLRRNRAENARMQCSLMADGIGTE
jgi:hypothetical protein